MQFVGWRRFRWFSNWLEPKDKSQVYFTALLPVVFYNKITWRSYWNNKLHKMLYKCNVLIDGVVYFIIQQQLPRQHQAMFQQCLMQWVHPDTVLTAANLTEPLLTSIRQQWYQNYNEWFMQSSHIMYTGRLASVLYTISIKQEYVHTFMWLLRILQCYSYSKALMGLRPTQCTSHPLPQAYGRPWEVKVSWVLT